MSDILYRRPAEELSQYADSNGLVDLVSLFSVNS